MKLERASTRYIVAIPFDDFLDVRNNREIYWTLDDRLFAIDGVTVSEFHAEDSSLFYVDIEIDEDRPEVHALVIACIEKAIADAKAAIAATRADFQP